MYMDFFRHKAAILAAILCLGIVAGILWFCLAGPAGRKTPDGVLVREAWPGCGAAGVQAEVAV